MKYNSEDVPLISLTHKFINDFDFDLRVEKRMQASTVLGRMIALKKIITRAINQGTLRRNPFMNYVAEQPLKKYRHLTEEEFQKLLTDNDPKILPYKGLVCFFVFYGSVLCGYVRLVGR